MSIHKAWYVNCDRCGDPYEISTESAPHARQLAKLLSSCHRLRGDESRVMEDVCWHCMTPDERKRSGATRPGPHGVEHLFQ